MEWFARPTSGRCCALLLVSSLACTAEVGDDPFSTVGMSGGTATGSGPSTGADASGEATASGESGSGDGPTGSSDGDSTGGGVTTADADCMPPCDPMLEVCEAGQCVPPGAPLAGQVVVSELMPNPELVTDDDGEWIELTNVGAEPVDIEGCVLYDASTDEDVIDSGAPIVVPPGGAVVLAKMTDMALNGGIPGVPYGFATAYTLANTGDEVRLECGGVVIDEVVYTETWPFGAGVAMQLSSASLDAASNDDVGSWCLATVAYGVGDLGTPGQANVGC